MKRQAGVFNIEVKMYIRFIIAVVLMLNLTACVGYDVLSGGKTICENFGDVYHKCTKGDFKDKSELLTALGNPDKIARDNDKELYIYKKQCQFCNKQLAFRGVV